MSIYCDKCGTTHNSSVCPSCSGFGKNPPMTADDVRARFEAWLASQGFTSKPEQRPSGKYVNGQIQGNWLAWQAAHADMAGEVRELVEAASQGVIDGTGRLYFESGHKADNFRRALVALAKHTHPEKP